VADVPLLNQAAETLELSFRLEWKNTAWPDYSGASSFFSEALDLSEYVVFVNHTIVHANGEREEAQVRLVRRGVYWKVSHAPI
jgi:hypothetical protein